ncbi:tail fiber domain-containing protein [Bdellovibrio sp. HCB209]|uniref:tail fiber domain-containing protein n=1 Tax=Bdellovibrio sp. HCB209 TaxID=3394354 RepID=UPI0039B61E0C
MRYWPSLLLIMVFFTGAAWASPDTFTYQGRIVRDNGTALEYNDVAFAFTITNEAGNCVLYREVKSHVNMQGSKGIFDVPIGSGVRQFPTDPMASIRNVFVNSVQLDCEGNTHYTAAENEGRILIVQFHDGVGWESITPSSKIRSVPFSTFSYSAGRLGNKLPGEYVLKSDVATCSTGQYLTFNGTTFTCQADSGGSGTISDINVSTPLTKGGTATLPTIGINVGTAAGTVAAGNDTRFGNALKIQGVDVNATAPTSGQVVRYDGTSSWVPATLGITDISGLSTQLSNKINATMFPTSCTAGQSLVFVTPANKFDCYDISISSSQISGTIPFSKISSLPTTLAGYGITDGLTGTGTAGYIPYYSGASTLASSAIYQSSGKVGIMTNTPRVGLENNGTFYTRVNYSGTMPTFDSTVGTDGGLIIGWNGDSGAPGRTNFINFPGIGAGGFSFHLANNSGAVTNTPMVINHLGHVGIGTTSPATKLEVVDTTGSVSRGITSTTYASNPGGLIQLRGARGTPASPGALNSINSFGWIAFSGFDGAAFSAQNFPTGLNAVSTEAWTPTGHGSELRLYTTPDGAVEGEQRLTITQDGKVGIGTPSPVNTLDIVGQVSTRGPASGYIALDRSGSSTKFGGFYRTADKTYISDEIANRIIVDNTSGNVGIGDPNPYGKLQVTGGNAGTFVNVVLDTASAGNHNFLYFRQGGANIGSISTATGANISYNTTSDVRLKDGFAPVNRALDKVNSIEIKNYYYKTDPSHRMDGFLAQQLYSIAPYAVTKPESDINQDGTIAPWLVDYSKMIPLVTASVQELSQKVEAQNREIASLKEENSKLHKEQTEIKKWICSKDPKSTICQ